VRSSDNPPGMVIGHVPASFELPVPGDAMQAEIWFHNFYQTSSRCSRFGENYWIDVGGAPPRIPAPCVDVTPAIQNNAAVKNHSDNRHGIDGYLDDAAVARRIVDALGGPGAR